MEVDESNLPSADAVAARIDALEARSRTEAARLESLEATVAVASGVAGTGTGAGAGASATVAQPAAGWEPPPPPPPDPHHRRDHSWTDFTSTNYHREYGSVAGIAALLSSEAAADAADEAAAVEAAVLDMLNYFKRLV